VILIGQHFTLSTDVNHGGHGEHRELFWKYRVLTSGGLPYDALYPVFQHSLVEVQDQSDPQARDSQVGQKLCGEDMFHSQDALDLDDDGVFNNEIWEVFPDNRSSVFE